MPSDSTSPASSTLDSRPDFVKESIITWPKAIKIFSYLVATLLGKANAVANNPISYDEVSGAALITNYFIALHNAVLWNKRDKIQHEPNQPMDNVRISAHSSAPGKVILTAKTNDSDEMTSCQPKSVPTISLTTIKCSLCQASSDSLTDRLITMRPGHSNDSLTSAIFEPSERSIMDVTKFLATYNSPTGTPCWFEIVEEPQTIFVMLVARLTYRLMVDYPMSVFMSSLHNFINNQNFKPINLDEIEPILPDTKCWFSEHVTFNMMIHHRENNIDVEKGVESAFKNFKLTENAK